MSSKIGLCFKNWFTCFIVLFIVSLMLSTSSPLFAQDDDEFTLEEIVVTAEKREAELQKVAMDISVVRPDEMERLNIHQVEDLGKMMPDMEITNFASGMLTISIRDVETNYWNPTSEATVAVHVDGIQLTRNTGLEGKLYDLERIETLKGPQGTLYGRGSTAGSMNMVSKRPDIGEFGGNLSLEYGSYDRQRIEGALNIPATEKLAFRLAVRRITRDGYDDANLGNQDMWGIRGSMKWEPTDTQSLVITLDRDVTDNKGGYSTGVYLDTYGDVEIVRNPALDITDPDDPNYVPEAWRQYLEGGSVEAPYKADWFIGDSALDQWNKNKSWGLSAIYDKEFETAWLTVQYGYRGMEEDKSYVMNGTPVLVPLGAYLTSMQFGDNTYNPETGVYTPANYLIYITGAEYGTLTPVDGASIMNSYSYDGTTPVTQVIVAPNTYSSVRVTQDHTESKMHQAEARLASKAAVSAGDKYEWLVGSMYMHDWVFEQPRIFENVDNEVLLEEYAVFAQASYVPFANINFTGGYRYTWDTKTFTGTPTTTYGYGNPDDWWERYPWDRDSSEYVTTQAKWDFSTYRANISWQATDDIMPYIQYSKGVKTGNVDRNGNFIEPETIDAYELGIRTRLFNGRLQLNATAYRYDYNNYNEWHYVYECTYGQSSVTPGTCVNATGGSTLTDADYVENIYTVLNVGSAKQEGANVTGTWMLTPSDIFTFSGSWSSNRRKNFDVAQAMIDYAEKYGFVADSADQIEYASDIRNGKRFGGAPLKGWVGYARTFWIGTDILTFNATGFYHGKGLDQIMREGLDDQYRMPGTPDYWTFDVALSYSSDMWMPEGVKWTLRVYSNNVFDSDALASRTYTDDTTYIDGVYIFEAGSGVVSGTYIAPRTSGIIFSVDF